MADYLTNTTELTSIADAIRTKGNISESLIYPQGFISGIENIETGGNSDIIPFPTSSDNSNAIIKFTNIDLTGQYSQIASNQYPSIDLTTLAGYTYAGYHQNIEEQEDPAFQNIYNLMAAILNLRIRKTDNNEYDISAYFSEWRTPQQGIQYQQQPWLVGGFFRYNRQQAGIHTSISLNGAGQGPSTQSTYDFPFVRMNLLTNTAKFHLNFNKSFSNLYSGTGGDYYIADLYNVILIEKQNYLH